MSLQSCYGLRLGQELAVGLLELLGTEHWQPAVCGRMPFGSSFPPFFSGMLWGAAVRWCSSLTKYKAVIFEARGNIPVGDIPSFPHWKEPVPGCAGGLGHQDSSHTLLSCACSQTSTGSPPGQQALVKHRFSSWNCVVFSILAIGLRQSLKTRHCWGKAGCDSWKCVVVSVKVMNQGSYVGALGFSWKNSGLWALRLSF